MKGLYRDYIGSLLKGYWAFYKELLLDHSSFGGLGSCQVGQARLVDCIHFPLDPWDTSCGHSWGHV